MVYNQQTLTTLNLVTSPTENEREHQISLYLYAHLGSLLVCLSTFLVRGFQCHRYAHSSTEYSYKGAQLLKAVNGQTVTLVVDLHYIYIPTIYFFLIWDKQCSPLKARMLKAMNG